MKILIAGSMKMSDEMALEVFHTILRIKIDENTIIVGDNRSGIDRVVIDMACAMSVPTVTYGIDPEPRHIFKDSGCPFVRQEYKQVKTESTGYKAYGERDRFMCDIADKGYFIWNGASKGTKAGYEYMKSLGKPAFLMEFSFLPNDGRAR
jgi:hypothetical protein